MFYQRFTRFFSFTPHVLLSSILFILLCASTVTAREVTLNWDPNSEPDLDHYVVYWGVNPGDFSNNSGNIGLITEYTADIPDDGQIYFFAVTAVDEAGLESDFSNIVSTDAPVVSFNSNWNLVSIPDSQETALVEEVLDPIMDDIISVWAYDNGEWLFYDPENPGDSSLVNVEPGKGLWVNMSSNADLIITGNAPGGGNIDLSAGWNLVGFSSIASQDISTAISSIVGNVESVWAYQNGKWKVYDPQYPEFSDLLTMDPGYGYWIKTNSSCTWIY